MNTHPVGAEQLALAQNKDLYEIGEIPPLGHVPASMYAWAVRKDTAWAAGKINAGRGRADLDARQP